MTEQDIRELMTEQTERLERARPQLTWKVIYAPAMANADGLTDRVIVFAWRHGQTRGEREYCTVDTFVIASSQDAVIDAMAARLERSMLA